MNQSNFVNKRPPLQNTENKKLPLGPSLRKELFRKKGPIARIVTFKDSSNLINPSLQSTKNLLRKITLAENEKPNLDECLNNKLNSPTTSKVIKHKTFGKLNVEEEKLIFDGLVAANLNNSNLIHSVEADLQKRATNLKPVSREKDPAPSVSDYFDISKFISKRQAIPQNTVIPKRKIKPYRILKEELVSDTDRLIGGILL